MKTDEANKIIAEYMRYVLSVVLAEWRYHESLDALVPVWEKLDDWDLDITFRRCNNEWQVDMDNRNIYIASDTIQEAACIATALAIKGLGK